MATAQDIASISASVPFSRVASPEEILAGILHPKERLDMEPYIQRLIFEVPASVFLEFCLRHGISAPSVKVVYEWHRARAGEVAPHVRAIEEFYYGLA